MLTYTQAQYDGLSPFCYGSASWTHGCESSSQKLALTLNGKVPFPCARASSFTTCLRQSGRKVEPVIYLSTGSVWSSERREPLLNHNVTSALAFVALYSMLDTIVELQLCHMEP